MKLQEFFNSFDPRLSPKTIRLMHGESADCLEPSRGLGPDSEEAGCGCQAPTQKGEEGAIGAFTSRYTADDCETGFAEGNRLSELPNNALQSDATNRSPS